MREERETSPEGRIAAVARVAMIRVASLRKQLPANFERFLPDYADLREALRLPLRRELLIAELEGLAYQTEAARARRRDEIVRELHAPSE